MVIKNCPKCGLPVNGMVTCPLCGTVVNGGTSREKAEKHLTKLKNTRITKWEIALIIILNLSFIAVAVNLIIGSPSWFQYPVISMLALYFISFTVALKTVNKFITRYRNTVLAIDLMLALSTVFANILNKTAYVFAFEYFIPVNLMLANLAMLVILIFFDVPIHRILVAASTFAAQSFILFVLMLFGQFGAEILPRTLIIVSFGINILTVINLAIIYAIKFRNQIFDGIHFWE